VLELARKVAVVAELLQKCSHIEADPAQRLVAMLGPEQHCCSKRLHLDRQVDSGLGLKEQNLTEVAREHLTIEVSVAADHFREDSLALGSCKKSAPGSLPGSSEFSEAVAVEIEAGTGYKYHSDGLVLDILGSPALV
jgi:hypothetical protein